MVLPLNRVGLIGCGRMGAAMGGHLLDAGTPLAVFDVVPDACGPLVERGAVACASPAEVAAQSRACFPFTEAVVRVGGIGSGQVAKTANNILLWANIRADVEALRLGRALGVEPARLREAMAIGSGANRPLAEWGKHRLRWPHKDLEVVLALAADAGLELALVSQLPALMRELTGE